MPKSGASSNRDLRAFAGGGWRQGAASQLLLHLPTSSNEMGHPRTAPGPEQSKRNQRRYQRCVHVADRQPAAAGTVRRAPTRSSAQHESRRSQSELWARASVDQSLAEQGADDIKFSSVLGVDGTATARNETVVTRPVGTRPASAAATAVVASRVDAAEPAAEHT